MRRFMRSVLSMLSLLVLVLTGWSAQAVPHATAASAAPPVSLVRVAVSDQASANRLVATGVDVTPHRGADSVDVLARGDRDLAKLRQAGFDYRVLTRDLAAHTQQMLERDEARAARLAPSKLPSGRNTYRSYSDFGLELTNLAQRRPDLVKPLTLPHRTVLGRSVRGVEITADVDKQQGKPVFAVVGVHHAREWPTAEVAMEFATELVNKADSDPRIAGLLQQTRVIVVPIVNPDGYAISRSFISEYKRKNCRVDDERDHATPAQCADTDNADLGVDLNRNYGGNWGGRGASPDPTSNIYRGAAPFSEPEVQNVRELVSSRAVTSLQSLHTYGGLVLRPPQQSTTALTADEPTYRKIGAQLADATGYRNIPSYQLYDTSGSTGEWSYFTTGGFGFEFELGGDNFHVGYQQAVIDQYFGTGSAENADGGVREALLRQAGAAANRSYHSVITGSAPTGATLSVRKAFTQYTAPVRRGDDTTGPRLPYRSTVHAKMQVPAGGSFDFDVNPSVRPDRTGHRIAEQWTLRCQRADGTVLQRVRLTLGRGEQQRVDLSACSRKW